MAELLIRVIDKVNEDFYLNTKCTKRGDVIVVAPDDWPWGTDELSVHFWRILSIPQMEVSEAEALLAPELDIDPREPSRTLQRRAFMFDLDSLPQNIRTILDDDTRAVRKVSLNALPLATIRALKVEKRPIIDPNVIGDSTFIIG